MEQEQATISCQQTLARFEHRLLAADLNEHGTLFGGRLLAWSDSNASISAMRVTHKTVVTATLDHVNFLHPFHLTDTVQLTSYVTGIHHRSLEVFTKGWGENLETGDRFLGFLGFTTFVVGQPNDAPWPQLLPITEEQQRLVSGYAQRYQQRQQERQRSQLLQEAIIAD